jgi:hypothetical protein
VGSNPTPAVSIHADKGGSVGIFPTSPDEQRSTAFHTTSFATRPGEFAYLGGESKRHVSYDWHGIGAAAANSAGSAP